MDCAGTDLPSDILLRLVDHAPDALLLVCSEGRIRFANATCTELLGYRPEELIGKPAEALVPRQFAQTHRDLRQVYQQAPTRRSMGRSSLLAAVHKDGSIIPVDIALSPIRTDDGDWTAVAIRDATDQRALFQELKYLATTDPLTGALNRRSLENAYLRELERCTRIGTKLFAIVLDIDYFKAINDGYGHKTGDIALKELTSACLKILRKTDVFARVGGEEFAILTSAKDLAQALQLAERVRAAVCQISVPAAPKPIAFTISAGVCEVYPGDRLSDALSIADEAMYAAKQAGRNRTVFRERPLGAPA